MLFHTLVARTAVALTIAGAVIAPAPAGAQTLEARTFAGGLRSPAPATTVAQSVGPLSLVGGSLYLSDESSSVLRVIDLASEIETALTDQRSSFNPGGIVADAAGTVYYSQGTQVFRRDPGGSITVVAGSGTSGSSGDGGPATSAQLRGPRGVRLDGNGNLFVADQYSGRVRRVDAITGVITTVAGTTDTGESGDGGLATEAQIFSPQFLAFDSGGNLLVGSAFRVRRVDAVTGIITTIAGGGSAWVGDGGPATDVRLRVGGLGVDGADAVYITSRPPGESGVAARVFRVDPATGTITTVAGGGSDAEDGIPATSSNVSPREIAVEPGGTLYIAGEFDGTFRHYRLRRVDGATGIISTFAGNGTSSFSGDGDLAVRAQLFPNTAVCAPRIGCDGASGVAAGRYGVFIADTFNFRVRKVARDGVITTVAGNGEELSLSNYLQNGDGGPATAAKLSRPAGVAVDRWGNLYIADQIVARIRKVSAAGIITTVAGSYPGFAGDGGPATAARLSLPGAVAVDGVGNLYIADSGNHLIRKVTPSGVISTILGASCVRTGTCSPTACQGTTPATTCLLFPTGLTFVGGSLYVADTRNHRLLRLQSGSVTVVAGTGEPGSSGDGGPAILATLHDPTGLAADDLGNVYVSDTSSHRVRRVTPAGLILPWAGSGTAGFSGEEGSELTMSFYRPAGLALASGTLYVVDAGNRRVRNVD